MDIRKIKNNRAERNRDLLIRMRRGEDLRLATPEQTFFPRRPEIKKDADAVRRLYGTEDLDKKK